MSERSSDDAPPPAAVNTSATSLLNPQSVITWLRDQYSSFLSTASQDTRSTSPSTTTKNATTETINSNTNSSTTSKTHAPPPTNPTNTPTTSTSETTHRITNAWKRRWEITSQFARDNPYMTAATALLVLGTFAHGVDTLKEKLDGYGTFIPGMPSTRYDDHQRGVPSDIGSAVWNTSKIWASGVGHLACATLSAPSYVASTWSNFSGIT